MIKMRQSDGNSVGRIIGFGDFFELQDILHHELNLRFFGFAVTGERGFHLQWRVVKDRETGLGAGEDDDSPSGPDVDDGFGVVREEEIFDGHGFGLVLFDLLLKEGVDEEEALLERGKSRGLKTAALEESGLATLLLDDAPAEPAGTGINANDFHASSL